MSETGDKALILASEEALFRWQMVSAVLGRELGGQKRAKAVAVVCAEGHLTPSGTLRTVSPRTLYRWLAAFQKEGLAGLEPQARPTVEVSEVLDDALIEYLRSEKTIDPRASVPELIRRAKQMKLVASETEVSRSTVWRAIKRMGLPTHYKPSKAEGDMRRYAYPNRMMMVLADGKHFRAGVERAKRVALFFIDDATRKGLHVVVGTSESTELFLRGLDGMIRKVGLMLVVFLDNGPGFISSDTLAVFARLPSVHLIHGTAGYPEGHGKVERFNQTADATLLRALDGAAEVDPDCGSLELRLDHYLSRQYNQRPHESLEGQSPAARWDADPRPLRWPEPEALRRCFLISEGRTVSKDHVIRQGGDFYEVPRGLGRCRVTIHRDVLTGELFLLHQGRTLRLHRLDREANARSGRGRARSAQTPVTGEGVARTAAMLAYDHDLGPVVDNEGGFIPPGKEK